MTNAKRIDKASRLIHASAERTYQAFADPDALERWLPPTGMIGSMRDFDFREGGAYRMLLSHTDPDIHTDGKTSEHADEVNVEFIRLIPNALIEQAVVFDTESPEYSGVMKIIWSLESVEDGTRVTVSCEDVPYGIESSDHQAGLTSTLENLASFVEGTR